MRPPSFLRRSSAQQLVQCPTCFEEKPPSQFFGRSCCTHASHCRACWTKYASISLEGRLNPQLGTIRCLDAYCQSSLTLTELRELAGTERVEKALARNAVVARHGYVLDATTLRWARSSLRLCPACCEPIEKHGGCDNMRCEQCGHRFKWSAAERFRSPADCRRTWWRTIRRWTIKYGPRTVKIASFLLVAAMCRYWVTSLFSGVVTVARTSGWALAVVHVLGAVADLVRSRHDLRLRPASPPFLVQCFHEAFSVSPQRQRAAIMRLTIFAVFSADLLRSLCLGRRDAWLAVAVTAAAPRLIKCIRGLHGTRTVIYVVPPRMTREQWHRLVRLGAMAVVGACAWLRR